MYKTINPIWYDNRKMWRVSIQKDGIRKTFSSTVPRSEGKKIVRQKALEWLNYGDRVDSLAFADVYDRFLQFYVEKCGKNTSYYRYISVGKNHILPRLGELPVGKITLDQFQDCISKATPSSQRVKTLSKRSLGCIREALAAFMKWAKPRKYISEDFSSQLYIPKSAQTIGKEILQISDIQKWFSNPTCLWYERALQFQLLVGWRPGEVLGLKPSDYNPHTRILTINRAINRRNEITPGKNKNAHRSVCLSGPALELLEEQLEVSRALDSDWLFCGKFGQRPSPEKYYQTMNKIVEALDLPHVTPYCLRHTFFTLVEGYLPSRAMKAIFGHSDATDSHALYGEHTIDGELVGISDRLKVTPLYQAAVKVAH